MNDDGIPYKIKEEELDNYFSDNREGGLGS
jgi:hypothetical protein